MPSLVFDFFVVLFLAACAFRLEVKSPFGKGINEDYLSAESGKYLRGLLALTIVFHHLAQYNKGFILLPIFSKLGYLTVSVFFFLSGFGMMKKHILRENYGRQFLLRRLPAILIPYLLANGVYWIKNLLLGKVLTIGDILYRFRIGDPIVEASWYIISTLALYIGFWLLMCICKRKFGWMCIGGVIYCGAYGLLCKKIGFGSWWYNAIPTVVIGMMWAVYEQKIDRFFKSRYPIAGPGVIAAFVVFYGIKIVLNGRHSSGTTELMMTWCAVCLFACSLMVILMKLRLQSPILRWVGEISMELYLYHFLFISLLRSPLIMIESNFLYVFLVLVCALGFSYGMHQLDSWLLKAYSKVLAR